MSDTSPSIEDILKDLGNRFTQRPMWLQAATMKILAAGSLIEKDIDELVRLCKLEAAGKEPHPPILFDTNIFTTHFSQGYSGQNLRVKSISEVRGINALAPTKSLEFGSTNLLGIYGINGSGKSGYARILKNTCGARAQGNLHQNVYVDEDLEMGCSITIEKNGVPETISWAPDHGVVEALLSVDIYDTECANVYLTKDNEVAFEPKILVLFTNLVQISQKISALLEADQSKIEKKLPELPNNIQETDIGQWYKKISHKTLDTELEGQIVWDEDMARKLNELTHQLTVSSPTKKVREYQNYHLKAKAILTELKNLHQQLSNDRALILKKAFYDLKKKKKLAQEGALVLANSVPLTGLGSETWKALWESAKQYSESLAYPNQTFPFTGDKSRCVMCQQTLSPEGKERMNTLDEYIKSDLENAVRSAQDVLLQIKESFPEVPDEQLIDLKLTAAKIEDENLVNQIKSQYLALQQRKVSLIGLVSNYSDDEIEPLPEQESLFKNLDGLIKAYTNQIEEYHKLTQSASLNEALQQQATYQSQQWLKEQAGRIKDGLRGLREYHILQESKRLCDTSWLTRTKTTISQDLITKSFANRFTNELEKLGASHLPVKIEQVKSGAGRVRYRIIVETNRKGIKISDVLSEGEQRIVSLAAFIADVEGREGNSPFIFDDPISSLDQPYEKATVRRLVELSRTRQVIVFSHRLSLLYNLESTATEAQANYEVIQVKRRRKRTGEPESAPLIAQKPIRALNTLKSNELARAKRKYKDEEYILYDDLARGLCGKIRELVERVIETILINEIVQRYRLSIMTKGRLEKLSRITLDDTKYIEAMMTKYSFFEHPQPADSPISLPEPDELEGDIDALIKWSKALQSDKDRSDLIPVLKMP